MSLMGIDGERRFLMPTNARPATHGPFGARTRRFSDTLAQTMRTEADGPGEAHLVGSFFRRMPGSGWPSRTALNCHDGAVTGFSGVIIPIVVAMTQPILARPQELWCRKSRATQNKTAKAHVFDVAISFRCTIFLAAVSALEGNASVRRIRPARSFGRGRWSQSVPELVMSWRSRVWGPDTRE